MVFSRVSLSPYDSIISSRLMSTSVSLFAHHVSTSPPRISLHINFLPTSAITPQLSPCNHSPSVPSVILSSQLSFPVIPFYHFHSLFIKTSLSVSLSGSEECVFLCDTYSYSADSDGEGDDVSGRRRRGGDVQHVHQTSHNQNLHDASNRF